MTAPLTVTGWSAVSAYGIGAEAFAGGVISGRSGLRQREAAGPDASAGLDGSVPGLNIREQLGRKNTRTLDRITALTLLAISRLLDSERAAGHHLNGDDTGLVLGTTAGSVQSMMDLTRDSFTREKPYMIDPARFPNGVMNCAGGQSAIWHGLRGPNATIASGQVAGLSVLRYAMRLHRSRHARSVLCGAVEELSPQREWLERQRGEVAGGVPLGEGCAVFQLESPDDAYAGGRTALAQLLATSFRVHACPSETPAILADCVSSVLQAVNATAADVWLVAGDLTEAQHAGLSEVLGNGPERCALAPVLGDCGAASAALLLAAVLSRAQDDPASRRRLAIVASVDRDGPVGAAAFRLPASAVAAGPKGGGRPCR